LSTEQHPTPERGVPRDALRFRGFVLRPSLVFSGGINPNGAPEDRPSANPSIDPAPVVADEESVSLASLDQVKVFVAFNPNENDVTHLRFVRPVRADCDDIAVVDQSAHRVTARSDDHGLASQELLNRPRSPSHLESPRIDRSPRMMQSPEHCRVTVLQRSLVLLGPIVAPSVQ
jgi:hypothetical protein